MDIEQTSCTKTVKFRCLCGSFVFTCNMQSRTLYSEVNTGTLLVRSSFILRILSVL